eukprot:3388251-Rhodomonas_salina.1
MRVPGTTREQARHPMVAAEPSGTSLPYRATRVLYHPRYCLSGRVVCYATVLRVWYGMHCRVGVRRSKGGIGGMGCGVVSWGSGVPGEANPRAHVPLQEVP